MSNLHKLKESDLVKDKKRDNLDSGILVNPLNSKNVVTDGRVETIIFDNGANVWASKQNGI